MNRLYKSNKDKVFDGVCGGLGEYFSVDPVIIRLLWVVLAIFGGTGVLAYLVAMLIIPKYPENEIPVERAPKKQVPDVFTNRFWGLILVVAGFLLLFGFLKPLGGIFAGLTVMMGHIFWPILVIGLGLYLYFDKGSKDKPADVLEEVFPPGKKLYKSQSDRRISGVCGGIGHYFDIDSNIIRIFWTMASLGSMGFGIIAYLGLAIYLKDAD